MLPTRAPLPACVVHRQSREHDRDCGSIGGFGAGLVGGVRVVCGARACPIADEENSQRPTFFLSMGGNLYFTCAAQHSVGVSCL